MARLAWMLIYLCTAAGAQHSFPHPQAHAHNDYEHTHPLFDALRFGFTSVEADVHLKNGKLLVSHNRPGKDAKTLQAHYLAPLDSLLRKNQGVIYPGYQGVFYLMIDCKTEAVATYMAVRKAVSEFQTLRCGGASCAVKIFLSGNRAVEIMRNEGYQGIALDGRPDDVGKGFSPELMPVISDNYKNWCEWGGQGEPKPGDLDRIRALAEKVHTEGKKLRLWAIPDNEQTWATLLEAGVDFINTDRLKELDEFLQRL